MIVFLALCAALGATAVATEIQQAADANPETWVRTAWKNAPGTPGSWELIELLSHGALLDTGILFDLCLLPWESKLASRQYRAFVLADVTGGEGRHIVILAARQGFGWTIDLAFSKGNGKAPADMIEVATTALATISTPVPASMPFPGGAAIESGRVPLALPAPAPGVEVPAWKAGEAVPVL